MTFRFQYAAGNNEQNEGFDAVVADKLISPTSEFGRRMKEMSVNDMKQLLLRISEEAAQELLLSIPNEHINKECVMKTNKFQFDII